MIRALRVVAAGVLFGVGLAIAGMTQPAKVLAFLDFGGAWDPSLAFVMGAAIAVFAPIAWWARARAKPVDAPRFELPAKKTIDASLVVGSALFGVGWGLSGYCPGPAVMSIAGAAPATLLFLSALLVGSAVTRALQRRADPRPAAEPIATPAE